MASGDKDFEKIFREQIKILDESFEKRTKDSKLAREEDRQLGIDRSKEFFPEGILGTISESGDPALQELIGQRQQLVDTTKQLTGEGLTKAQAELARVDSQFNQLIADRGNLNSAATQAQRDAGKIAIQQALKTQLRSIRGSANLGNVGPAGLPAGMLNDALGSATQARMALERDLILDSRRAVESLTAQRAGAVGAGLEREAAFVQGAISARDAAIAGTEGAIRGQRADTLDRQLINLDARARELFGRLSTEENIVSQGISERTGLRQQLVAEANAAESARHARETERIQEIEAKKPPPSSGGGGGKSVMCIAHWILGTIDLQELLIDLNWACHEDNVSESVRKGYYWYSTPLANHVLRHPHGFHAKWSGYLVRKWVDEVLYMEGYRETGSLVGRFCLKVMMPITSFIGKALSWLGVKDEDIVPAEALPIHEYLNAELTHFEKLHVKGAK